MRMPIVIKKNATGGFASHSSPCMAVLHSKTIMIRSIPSPTKPSATIATDIFEIPEAPAPPSAAVNRSLKYRLPYTQFALFKPEKQEYIPI